MNDDSQDLSLPPSNWRLRAPDQAVVAALAVLGLVLIGGSWIYRGGLRGQMVDIDRAERRPITFQLDINASDWPEWMQLPGIGEELARRIVDSRNADGPFRDHQDLLRVRGIGPRTLDRLRPYLLPVAEMEIAGGP